MLNHPTLSSSEFFHYSPDRPSRNLLLLGEIAALDATLVTLPAVDGAYSFATIDGRNTLQMQSVTGAEAAVQVLQVVDDDSFFEFEVDPTLLPSTASVTSYLRVHGATPSFEAVVYFSQAGLYRGVPTAVHAKLIDSETVAITGGTFRLTLTAAGDATLYHLVDNEVSSSWSWTAVAAGGGFDGLQVELLGTFSSPVTARVYQLRSGNVITEPAPATFEIDGVSSSYIGVLTSLDADSVEDPDAGVVEYLWELTAPPGAPTYVTEESAASVVLTTPLLKTVTFSMKDVDTTGNTYILRIVDAAPVALSVSGLVITLQYPVATTPYQDIRLALDSAPDDSYNPAVAALLEVSTSDDAEDLPAAGVYLFSGGAISTADSLSVLLSAKGLFVAYLHILSTRGTWSTEEYPISVSNSSVVFGSVPDVSFINRQVAYEFWKKIEGREKLEQAWQGGAQILASDMLDIHQTRMTRIFDKIPEFWRKRWYWLPMYEEFSGKTDITLPETTGYALCGVSYPTDDFDGDVTTFTMSAVTENVYHPVTVSKVGQFYYILSTQGLPWLDNTNVTLGSTVLVGGGTYEVVSVLLDELKCTLLSGSGTQGGYSSIQVTGYASGPVSGTVRSCLAQIPPLWSV